MNHLKSGASQSGTGDEKPYSEISDYVGQLEYQCGELTNVLHNLRSRLHLVLQPEPPKEDVEKAATLNATPKSPLANQLKSILDSNYSTIWQFNDLIDRLQS